MENSTITLSAEQFEEMKRQIKEEMKEERKGRWNIKLIEVQRKYHDDLIRVNGGQTWLAIRNIAPYLIGRKTVRRVPDNECDELAKVAERLCIEIIEAHKNTGEIRKF